MTDKEKIRTEIERLLNEPAPSHDPQCKWEDGYWCALYKIEEFIDSLQEEPVNEVWHDASEEPNDMSHCLIFYGCKESVGHYLHYEPVLYNKKEKMFVTSSRPHPTGYKIEQKSVDGGCVAEVYKDRRDRISISDITQWCYLCDLHNLSNVERTGKDLKEEPVSEDLEEAAIRAAMLKHDIPKEHLHEYLYNDYGMRKFVEGAKWQEEKDSEEQVLIYKHGFDDCKEYIKEHIKEVLLSEVLPCFMHGGEADEVVAKLDEVLNQKK